MPSNSQLDPARIYKKMQYKINILEVEKKITSPYQAQNIKKKKLQVQISSSFAASAAIRELTLCQAKKKTTLLR